MLLFLLTLFGEGAGGGGSPAPGPGWGQAGYEGRKVKRKKRSD